MGRMLRSCLQSMLKLLNSVIAMFGIAMILYALWMLRAWQKELGPSGFPFPSESSSFPWFIYTFLFLGITLCVITCSGHIAAETANGICLYFYMLFVFLLIMLEGAVTADVFLNHSWEEDFPLDPSGRFDEFKDFVRSNFEMCKWIGLSLVSVQGLSILLALILKALGPFQRTDDSDDDYEPARLPLLKTPAHQPPYVVGEPVYGSKNGTWNLRTNDKTNR